MHEHLRREPNRQDVRAFSKDHFQDSRDRLAENVMRLRKEYFAREKQRTQRMNTLTATIETLRATTAMSQAEYSEKVRAILEQIQAIESEYREERNGRFERICNGIATLLSSSFRNKQEKEKRKRNDEREGRVRFLEFDLALLKLHTADPEKYFQTLTSLEAELQTILETPIDPSPLEKAKSLLHSFSKRMSNELQAYEAERDALQVSRLSHEHDSFFLHGTRPTGTLNNNVYEHLGADEKMLVVIALRPSIAVYSFRHPGDAKQMWAECGLIIGGGRIGSVGATTKALAVKKRRPVSAHSFVGMAARAQEVLASDRKQEMTVDEPAPVGLYTIDVQQAPKLQKVAEQVGLPLFIIAKGNAYRYNPDEPIDLVSHPLRPKDIIPNEPPRQTFTPQDLHDALIPAGFLQPTSRT